jgi:hypothetical protein
MVSLLKREAMRRVKSGYKRRRPFFRVPDSAKWYSPPSDDLAPHDAGESPMAQLENAKGRYIAAARRKERDNRSDDLAPHDGGESPPSQLENAKGRYIAAAKRKAT